MKSSVLALVAGLALVGVASAASATNLVSDGDFSTPPGGSPYTTYTTSFGPWNVTQNGSVDLIGDYWQAPPSGGGSVDLDGNYQGGISQDLSLPEGRYVLSFYLSGKPDGGPNTKTVDVSAGGSGQTFDYTIGGNSRTDMQFAAKKMWFNSAGGPTKLTFQSDVPGPYGPVVGGVSLSAAPEPGAWALMLVGVGMLGAGARIARRKGRMAAATA